MIFWEIIIELWLSNKKVILTLKKIERWMFVCVRERECFLTFWLQELSFILSVTLHSL